LLENNFFALCSHIHFQVREQCQDCWVLTAEPGHCVPSRQASSLNLDSVNSTMLQINVLFIVQAT
jgi:sulfatase maturation enzyme AslB (radical SAM superfamily)